MLKFDISKFLKKFTSEAEERVENIVKGLLEIEKHPDDSETIHNLKREFHTLKGSAKMLGLSNINQLVHKMEDIFEQIENRKILIDSRLIDYLFKVTDILKVLIVDPKNATHPEYDNIMIILDNIQNQKIPENENKSEKQNAAPKKQEEKKTSLQSLPKNIPTKKEEHIKDTSISKKTSEIKKIIKKKQNLPIEKKSIKIKSMLKKTFRIDSRNIDELANMAIDLYSKNIFIKELLNKFEEINNRLARINIWGAQQSTTANGKEFQEIFDMIQHLHKYSNESFKPLSDNILDFEFSLNELLNKIDDIKLIPLSEAFGMMEKYVRDLSHLLKKETTFAISGQDTKIDKNMLEKLQDMLLHLIRNAIDHGIEPPLERKTKKKAAKGLIMLKAYQRGSTVYIEVIDDGRGLDKKAIMEKAVEKKIITQAKAEELSDEEIYNLIFEPNFSTKKNVTDISGRGVGMDVVKNTIAQLKGKLNIFTIPNEGTTFQLILPISVAATELLFIELENKKYGIDNNEILTIIPTSEIKEKEEEKHIYIYDEKVYHIYNLKDYLNIAPKNKEKYLILLKGDNNIALLVDNVLYTDQVIVKTFSEKNVRPKFFRGGTVFSSGNIVLVIDIAQIIDAVVEHGHTKTIRQISTHASNKGIEKKNTTRKTVLLVEDSLITRDMERAILEAHGYNVITAVDGYNALQKIGNQDFDIVITDIEMPNMNGLELTENLRKIPKYKNVPIIIVSSLSKPEIKIQGIQKGANAYFVKSEFQEEHFLNTVSHLTG